MYTRKTPFAALKQFATWCMFVYDVYTDIQFIRQANWVSPALYWISLSILIAQYSLIGLWSLLRGW